MKSFLERFMPFLVIGVAIVVGIIGIFLLSYVIIWGAVIAGVLYLITWISNKFKKTPQAAEHKGRTIDHEK
jgi:hypothetical protein